MENVESEKCHYVYCITNEYDPLSDKFKFYIGIHYGKLNDRYMGSGKEILKELKLYGKANFHKHILKICSSRAESSNEETRIVDKQLIARPDCLNKALGGNRGGSSKGTKQSTEWIESRTKSLIGKKHIYNPITGEAKKIPSTEELPLGFIWGTRPLTKEAVEKSRSTGRINIYNPRTGDEKHILKTEPIPDEYIKGIKPRPKSENYVNSCKDRKRAYNPTTGENRYLKASDILPDGFVFGSPPVSEETSKKLSEQLKGRIYIYNKDLDIMKRIFIGEEIPDGFILGTKPRSKEFGVKTSERVKNSIFVYNKDLDIVRRINKNAEIPEGFIKGNRFDPKEWNLRMREAQQKKKEKGY